MLILAFVFQANSTDNYSQNCFFPDFRAHCVCLLFCPTSKAQHHDWPYRHYELSKLQFGTSFHCLLRHPKKISGNNTNNTTMTSYRNLAFEASSPTASLNFSPLLHVIYHRSNWKYMSRFITGFPMKVGSLPNSHCSPWRNNIPRPN